MEIRLFIVACIMYLFYQLTKKINKKNNFYTGAKFSKWYFCYLILFLSCALYLILFVMSGGSAEFFDWKKMIGGEVLILGYSIYEFIKIKTKNTDNKLLEKKALEWCNTIYFAGFVASIVMFFLIQAFKIPSASMRDTLLEGDHLFVNKAYYNIKIPFINKVLFKVNEFKKGDIVIFKFPAKDKTQENCGSSQYGRDFVKRVVGLPGDKVEVKEGMVYVNDTPFYGNNYEKYENIERYSKEENLLDEKVYQDLWESHILDNYFGLYLRDQFGPVIVPEKTYFVMGDNRDNSCDSRFWGPVPEENMKGKAWFIHWPLSRIRIIK